MQLTAMSRILVRITGGTVATEADDPSDVKDIDRVRTVLQELREDRGPCLLRERRQMLIQHQAAIDRAVGFDVHLRDRSSVFDCGGSDHGDA